MRAEVENLGADATHAHEDAVGVVEAEDDVGGRVDVLVRGFARQELRVHLQPVRADVEEDEGETREEVVGVLAGEDHEETGGGESVGDLR